MTRKQVPSLEIRGLKKSFGQLKAVSEISFSVQPKEIVGLLGPNGAGKTTTINMILGVLAPDDGSILIEGVDALKKRNVVIDRTNFAATYTQLPGNLTVYQNLYIFGLIYNVDGIRNRINEILKEFNLEMFRNTKCGVLSSGEQTRVILAKAMLNNPNLLLLDEPTASLDPSTAQIVREKIKEYAARGSRGILWTSHNMYEVTEVCDRVLFLSHGKIFLEGDPKVLPGKYGKKNLEELFISIAREPLDSEETS